MHHPQINFLQSTQVLSTQQRAYQSFSINFPGLIPFASLPHAWCLSDNYVHLSMNYSFLTTIYKRDIRIHYVVVTSHGAGKATYHVKNC